MELLVAMAIVSIVAVSAGSMLVAGMRTFQARHVGNMVAADMRFAMELMARDLRAATDVSRPSASQIRFTSPGDAASLSRSFYLSTQTVTRLQGGVASPLAANVESLNFVLETTAIRITMTSVSSVDGVVGSGLPLTLTTRVMRRN